MVARAFGANEIIVADVKDCGIEKSVRKVVEKWGGNFRAVTGIPWREAVENAKSRRSQIIHLTMHGTPLQETLPTLEKSSKAKLVIIGATRVPSEVYRLADMNINITSEPHSEVAALAVFLDRLLRG
ncbi:MAG: tRNA (cytidine(56)-2'-O)-methyltransferase [Candidatus Bathyarchaeia archaeon]